MHFYIQSWLLWADLSNTEVHLLHSLGAIEVLPPRHRLQFDRKTAPPPSILGRTNYRSLCLFCVLLDKVHKVAVAMFYRRKGPYFTTEGPLNIYGSVSAGNISIRLWLKPEENGEYYPVLDKGQLISEWNCGVFKSPKKWTIFWWMCALATEMGQIKKNGTLSS